MVAPESACAVGYFSPAHEGADYVKALAVLVVIVFVAVIVLTAIGHEARDIECSPRPQATASPELTAAAG